MKKISLLAVFCLLTMAFYNTSLVKGEESYNDLGLASLLLTANADSETSGSDCDKCVIEKDLGWPFGKATVFSCKTVEGEYCSYSKDGYNLTCNNALEC